MKFQEIREKKEDELNQLESGFRQELAMFQMQVRLGQVAPAVKIRKLKKDIARILTAIHQKTGKGKV